MTAGLDPSQIRKTNASDLLRDLDLAGDELRYLLDLAAAVKRSPGDYSQALAGKSIALLFEKPSLRTRLTFELAIKQLGGDSLFFEAPIGVREPLKDVARNLDRWVNGIVARVFLQDTIDALAQWSSVPVINALSDLFHPCQALADMQTIRERFGELQGRKLAFIGDGNNVANSWVEAAHVLGFDLRIACPKGYEPDPAVRKDAERIGRGEVRIVRDPAEAARGADVLYTDVWTSMGQEAEARKRLAAFKGYCVDAALLRLADPGAIVMHCLPAHRGEEITEAVLEGPHSAVFDEAENRLHVQMAVLEKFIQH